MADFDLAMAVDLEAGGAVAETDKLSGALDRLDASARKGAGGAAALEGATDGVGKSVVSLVGIEQRLDQVISSIQQNTVGAARGHAALRDAIQAQSQASAGLVTNTNAVAGAQAGASVAANSQAQAEARVTKAVADAERATSSAALAAARLAEAEDSAGIGAARLAREQAAAERSAIELARAEQQLAAATSDAERAAAAAALAQAKLAQIGQRGTRAIDDGTAASNRNAFALRNAGQQVGDFATQVALGGGVVRAFASQAGQMGYALSEFEKGPLARVGKFLVGPWGIAFTVAAIVVAPFIEKLFEANKALDEQRDRLEKASAAADSYGTAQSLLGKIIDLQTGKLKTQNEVLVQSIKLQAQQGILLAQQSQKDAGKALTGTAQPTIVESVEAAFRGIGRSFTSGQFGDRSGAEGKALTARLAPLKTALDEYKVAAQSYAATLNDPKSSPDAIAAAGTKFNASLDSTIGKIDTAAKSAGRNVIDVKKQVLDLGTALNDQRANMAVVRAIEGGGIAPELKPYQAPKKPKKPKSTAAVDEFGRDAADRIAAINEAFDETPAQVRKVNTAVRQLDDLIDDLTRKKPPNFKELIADAQAAKVVVRDALNKPFDDFILAQSRAFENQRLITAGKLDEAAAAQQVYAIERQQGPLTQERKDAILATVQALRAEQREADILREKQQAYLNTIGQIKTAVRGVIFDGVNGIKDLPKRLVQSFAQLKGEQLFQRLFGDVFRELEDQVKGVKTVQDASDKMAGAVDLVAKKSDNLGAAFDRLAGKVPAGSVPGAALGGDVAGAVGAAAGGAKVLDAAGRVIGVFDAPAAPKLPESAPPAPGEIVVSGNRLKDPQAFFANALGKLAKGVGISDAGAAKIGEIGGKAIKGAATGALTNSVFAPIAKGLGLKTSSTGAQIGGAIGSFVPIPGGDIIGSVVGSLIGGAFKKTKKASATIGSIDGSAGVTGVTGNSASYRNAADSLGGAVSDSLNAIVSQLGGDLGTFSVSIGQRKKKFVVDGSGSGRTKGSGTQKFDTEAEAQAAALANAIADGAVTGVSAAVQRALRSTPDVDKAVAEALKVKDVEAFIASAADALKAQFDAFDRAAAERVRIANKYGIDVIAVEKANAEARTKLVDTALKSAVGSLQDVLRDLTSGDLFEGSAAEKRTAILGQIDQAKAGVANGEEGAADQLAQLYRSLLETTRDAFGTAGGEFTSDRSTVATGAASVIAAERERIERAAGLQRTAIDAATRQNALTDETNTLLAQQNATLATLPADLAAVLATGGGAAVNYAITARKSALL